MTIKPIIGEVKAQPINDNFSFLASQFSNFNGSPKGTYATFVALQTAKPNGDTGIYLVTADGKWYYWSGTVWTAGGVYQASSIAAESVTTDKLGDITKSKNRFNKASALEGFYVDRFNGTLVPSAPSVVSEYMDVNSDMSHTLSMGITLSSIYLQAAFYDSAKKFVSGLIYTTVQSSYLFAAPANAKYVRFSLAKVSLDRVQFELGTDVTAFEEYYMYNKNLVKKGEGIVAKTEQISNGIVSSDKLTPDVSTKIGMIDGINYDIFLDTNDNANFDLATISDANWYKPEASFIDPCTNAYLLSNGVKNWVHLDADEFNNSSGGKGYRDIHYKMKYANSIGGKYFQTIFYVYSEAGDINSFKLSDTFVSTGSGFSLVTPTEIFTEQVPGNPKLWKVRKSGVIPSGEFKEVWIGASFHKGEVSGFPDLSVGGFYGKVFAKKPDGKDGFATKLQNVPPLTQKNSDDIVQIKKDLTNIAPVTKHKWNGKNLVMLGDSITWYDGKNYPDGTKSIGYLTNMDEEIHYASMLNKGVSGACIARNENAYEDVCDTVKSVDFSSTDIVIIAAGVNDYGMHIPLGTLGTSSTTTYDRTTFYGAYREIIEYILTAKPSVQIVLFTPVKRSNFDNNNNAGNTLGSYAKAVKDVGELYSLPVMNLYSLSGVNKLTIPLYTIDNLHLNNLGYERVTKNVIVPFLETV